MSPTRSSSARAALPLSLTLSRFTNGLTRPFFGWVSDHVGRENTMGLAFLLEAAAILVMFAFIDKPALFVVMTGLVFFGWGEIFSLFPSTLADTFGTKFATTNYGCLYIAQGIGSFLGVFCGGAPRGNDRQLDHRLLHRRRTRRDHRDSGALGAQIHAPAASWRRSRAGFRLSTRRLRRNPLRRPLERPEPGGGQRRLEPRDLAGRQLH